MPGRRTSSIRSGGGIMLGRSEKRQASSATIPERMQEVAPQNMGDDSIFSQAMAHREIRRDRPSGIVEKFPNGGLMRTIVRIIPTIGTAFTECGSFRKWFLLFRRRRRRPLLVTFRPIAAFHVGSVRLISPFFWLITFIDRFSVAFFIAHRYSPDMNKIREI